MMLTREDISIAIEDYISTLRFPEKPEGLYAPIIYSLQAGGKRIRPLLTMMACNVFDDDPMKALPCAASIELFHNFTLLHDDIMDNAKVRRGRATVHRRWGDNAAILSGDAMVIYSYSLLEGAPQGKLRNIFHIFNDISLRVCDGQQYDMEFERLENVSLEQYMEMINCKTAVLMSGASVIGGICGGASEADCLHLETFGTQLGLAFQIKDDILDCYGAFSSLGKDTGGDILEGKKTYLTISALQRAEGGVKRELLGLLHNKEMIPEEKISRVLDIYDSLNIRPDAEQAVEGHSDNALRALESLSVSESRLLHLRELTFDLTTRKS